MLDNLLDLLRADGSIVVNKKLAKKIGLEEAAIYSELASQRNFWSMRGEMSNDSGKIDPSGKWFYCTIDKLEEHTGVKRKKQDRVIKSLVSLNLIEVRLLGLPSKRYFKITDEIFTVMFGHKIQFVPNGQPDDTNVSSVKNSQKAHNGQVVPNGQASVDQTDKLDGPKRTTSNNRSINNKSINKLEDEDGPKMVVELFKKNFETCNPAIERELINWTTKVPVEVISNEIEYAAKNGAKTFQYLDTALTEDELLKIDSIEKLEVKREDHKIAKSRKSHRNPAGSSKSPRKHLREEKSPEWLADQQKQYEAVEVSKKPINGNIFDAEKEKQALLDKLAQKKTQKA